MHEFYTKLMHLFEETFVIATSNSPRELHQSIVQKFNSIGRNQYKIAKPEGPCTYIHWLEDKSTMW